MEIKVEDGNTVYDSRYNCNAIIKGDVLVCGCSSTVIPNNITTIGDASFEGCGVTTITIPSNITEIGKDAFSSCYDLTSVILQDGLIKIGQSSFSHSGLISVNIPSTVTSIERYAFYGTKLKEIDSYIESPFVIDDNVFDDFEGLVYSTAVLSVPEGKVGIYKSTGGWKKFNTIQEIEPNPTSVIDNLTYIIHKRAKYAEIQSASSVDHIVIPTSVEYDNVQYPVTRILDAAFMENKMISLSIPSSVSYVGQNVLKNCNQLAAIVWEPTFKPSDEFVDHIANPNLLFYVTQEQYKPSGVRNVIVDNKNPDIILTDENIGNFYCPKAFTANNITYTHVYSLKTEKGKCQGWESIVLPFDVQTIETANGETIKPVSVAGTGEKRFWLRELKDSGFSESDGIKANVPYIISMPNWDGYQDFYNISGDVTFSAQEVTIQPSDNLQISTSGHYQFVPNYQVQEKSAEYLVLNSEAFVENGTSYAPGSAFKAELRNVHPFEAYLTNDGAATVKRYISIADLMGVTTSVSDIPGSLRRAYSDNGTLYVESVADGSCNIYSLSGLLTRTLSLKRGLNSIAGLPKGFYIVNGQKVLVQ